ncbi:5'-nucleotidase [Candidatus Magnetomorum sp. HK-1]|nr:5'-nucleotidase [Candidatus Magnetomorum sp. HK-1]
MEKRIWIENYFDYNFTKKLIICSNKGLLKGDLLIDDNIEGRGQESFEGKIIHFGSSDFPDWQSVYSLLFC